MLCSRNLNILTEQSVSTKFIVGKFNKPSKLIIIIITIIIIIIIIVITIVIIIIIVIVIIIIIIIIITIDLFQFGLWHVVHKIQILNKY